jgi:hypothetical protein
MVRAASFPIALPVHCTHDPQSDVVDEHLAVKEVIALLSQVWTRRLLQASGS